MRLTFAAAAVSTCTILLADPVTTYLPPRKSATRSGSPCGKAITLYAPQNTLRSSSDTSVVELGR